MIFPEIIFAQIGTLTADFDGDKIEDRVYKTDDGGTVIYELSSQNFKVVSCDDFGDSGEITLSLVKDGFKVGENQMRAGNSYQFRYEKLTKKMRLIGMQRFEFGPASNDGSGKSSVNLLTNNYIGEWNYYDDNKNELIKIPVIKKKMILPKTYFDNVGSAFSTYLDQDYKYYISAKKSMIKNAK